MFYIGKLKILQTSATTVEVEDSEKTSEKDSESIPLAESDELANENSGDNPDVVDTLDLQTTHTNDESSIDSEAVEREELDADRIDVEAEMEENCEEDQESENDYEEEPDMDECNYEDEQDEELDERDDVELDNEDDVDVDEIENDNYMEEEANDEDYIRSLGITDISSQFTNHEFDDLQDLEDLARTTEHNMSEELSQATFNLMADLENESSNDYFE